MLKSCTLKDQNTSCAKVTRHKGSTCVRTRRATSMAEVWRAKVRERGREDTQGMRGAIQSCVFILREAGSHEGLNIRGNDSEQTSPP